MIRKLFNYIHIILPTTFVMAVIYYLIHAMSIGRDGKFGSDYVVQITEGINPDIPNYTLLAIVMRFCYAITHDTKGIVLFMVLCYFFATLLIYRYYKQSGEETGILWYLALSVLFIESIYLPQVHEVFQLNVNMPIRLITIVGQPWHNSTYASSRVFDLAGLLVLLRVIEGGKKEENVKNWILLLATFGIANAIKPSYFICLAPALLIWGIWKLIRNPRYFGTLLYCASALVLSMIPLLYQYLVLFGADDGNSWTATWELFSQYVFRVETIYYLFTDLGMPIMVSIMLIVRKRFTDDMAISWLTLIVSIIISRLLWEVGPRMYDGNFIWGRYAAGFMLYVVCLKKMIELRKEEKSQNTFRSAWLKLAFAMYALNVINGIMYFGIILSGYTYAI